MNSRATEVAIIGAGPYGLSIAAHLRHRGVAFRIFGTPMSFWLRMPASINLKSFAFATNVYVPRRGYTFPEYCRAHGLEDVEPCSMASFAEYGLWVQRTVVPGVEPVDVLGLRTAGREFELTLASGESLRARRVVIAVGLTYFAHLPQELARLPRELVSHTAEHTEFSRFAGKKVAVVGAGASALEAATMVREAGGDPLVFVRGPEVVFHTKMDPKRSVLQRVRNPNSVLGPGRKSWVIENFPLLLHYVPDERRVRFTRSFLGPAAPWWLWDRFAGKVPYRVRSRVTGAEANGSTVRLQIGEEGQGARSMDFDHVIAGTGFRPDVDRVSFLDPSLRDRIRRLEAAPALSRNFESSVPGIYFVGAAAAFSFGPLFRFVAGASCAAPTVARHVTAQRTRSSAFQRLAPGSSWLTSSAADGRSAGSSEDHRGAPRRT